EQGEHDRAKPLFAEGLTIAKALPDTTNRRRFAAQLVRADLPAALALIESLPTPQARATAVANAAMRLAGTRPADCEQWLGMLGAEDRARAVDIVCHRMAPVDPERARRLVDAQRDVLA